MLSHIDSVGSVMFVEISSRHQETPAIKAQLESNLVKTPPDTTHWNH